MRSITIPLQKIMTIKDYYIFLTSLIGKDPNNSLLQYLFEVDYIWIFPLDRNRAQDGIDLRCWWANMNRLDKETYDAIFANKGKCSMLEMFIAFANRIENDFMGNAVDANRTPLWFDEMLQSLGIYNDLFSFDQANVDHILLNFFDHKISLFKIPGGDISKMQLWDQMNCWLNYIN